jgi:tRNA threonylcarbamoyladenosine biosynthesis protein TsaE
MRRAIENLTDMQSFAAELAQEGRDRLVRGERFLIMLDGPMGAGKTQFTRFFTAALLPVDGQAAPPATSPTYAIHNSYVVENGVVEHFDLYRLRSEEELESTGFWDFFGKKSGVIMIEWANRLNDFGLGDQLPRSWPKISLRISILDGATPERRELVINRRDWRT